MPTGVTWTLGFLEGQMFVSFLSIMKTALSGMSPRHMGYPQIQVTELVVSQLRFSVNPEEKQFNAWKLTGRAGMKIMT